jgi:hypothetical protein
VFAGISGRLCKSCTRNWANDFQCRLGRRNPWQRRTGQSVPDKLRKKSRERSDVFLDARSFQRGHVCLALRERNDRPGIACRGHHVRVHQLVRNPHGYVLSDSEVLHVFTMNSGLIAAMDLGDADAAGGLTAAFARRS